MSSPRELLALRKEVLVARATLQRLKVACEVEALRENLRWPRAVAAIAASPPARSALFGLLLLVTGRGRLARFVRIAAATLALTRLAGRLAAPARPPGSTGAA